jgi:DnaJ-class molecular chaperone
VHIKVQVPKNVSEKQADLLRQFEEEDKVANTASRSSTKSFIDDALKRVKAFMGVSSDSNRKDPKASSN